MSVMSKSESWRAMWRVEKARWPLPAAIIYHGSVYQRAIWGLTRQHAWRRGWRWTKQQSTT